jgi:hypothetical protein
MKMIDLAKLQSEEELVWFQHLLDRAIKDPYLLHRGSKCFSPSPTSLFSDELTEKRINEKLNRLYLKLGGVPEKFLIEQGAQITDRFDEFVPCAINEMVSIFHRARTNVVKTHSVFVAYFIVTDAPSTLSSGLTQEQLVSLSPSIKEEFWNCAEAAYIRLASLWDRAGQVLDYVFFNIRQFEHDGFPSVLDRVKANFSLLDNRFQTNQFWIAIKTYAYSEQVDGLKWLLRRRNLLIHSLHLGDRADRRSTDMQLQYYYNHLEESVRKKLAAMSPEDEMACLHTHLSVFATLLEPLCDLCLWGTDLIQEMRTEKESVVMRMP